MKGLYGRHHARRDLRSFYQLSSGAADEIAAYERLALYLDTLETYYFETCSLCEGCALEQSRERVRRTLNSMPV